jgi:hypothetical protein
VAILDFFDGHLPLSTITRMDPQHLEGLIRAKERLLHKRSQAEQNRRVLEKINAQNKK